MRLALILTEFPPGIGGMQTHAESLARALREGGHDISVYTYRCDDPRLAEEARAFDRDAGYPVHRVLSRLGFWANHQWLVARLRASRVALVYASNVYYGLLGPALGVPVVCRSAGNDVQRPWIAYPYRAGSRIVSHPALEQRLHRWYRRWNAPEWLEAAFRRRRQALVRRSVAANRLILANSAYTRDLLARVGADARQVRVLPGGVDTLRFAPTRDRARARRACGLDPDAWVLLTACRLVAKKGLDFLVAQVPALRQVEPRLQLVVVGDGTQRARCEAMVEAARAGEAVRLVGRVPQREIQRYYAAADAFVLASRITRHRVSGLHDAETMGRVLCEANAAGLPVLASRSGGIPSVVTHQDNGLLFESDDAGDFLRQFTRLHGDEGLRCRLVARGRERAEREFAWPHLVAEHLRAFEDTLLARPSGA
ncbi:glycoside hydrolase [Luteitalea sp. TBR-22]|uniref:glycosyltransferase family 4 protein n=1 Tax=Luteitalea sp. TBR-22 TaxID=2802971 RepID=UPI001AF3B87A|nr:glycosyltransferase family 4 protein [Luteitalea sp. TBR-22]BCS31834.1 glycoside hydrolase [Luteitalea sp. TBR-22]